MMLELRAFWRGHNLLRCVEERGYHTPAPADQKDWKARAMAAEVKLKEKDNQCETGEKCAGCKYRDIINPITDKN